MVEFMVDESVHSVIIYDGTVPSHATKFTIPFVVADSAHKWMRIVWAHDAVKMSEPSIWMHRVGPLPGLRATQLLHRR